jgi:CubicO group peptidase (beta-lactamase class C family)
MVCWLRFRGDFVRNVCIFGVVIVFLFATPCKRVVAQSRDVSERQIDAIFSQITAPDDPGCAVLIKYGGINVLEKGYGVRELRTRVKIDARTNFRLASVTKQFTAMAMLLLIHDGKLRYDERLTDIFPEFPAYGKAITVRSLLTHTSGLPDYEELMEKKEKAKGPIWSVDHQIQDAEVLALLEQESAGKFAPGTNWAYSNSGYVVLGLIITKVSGKPYRDFLRQRILSPAGMTHSIVYQKGVNEVPDRAYGHTKEGDKFVETDQSPTSATLGDGGVYSNLEDMGKWDDALEKYSLVSEKEMAPALTPVKLTDGSETRWPKSPNEDNPAEGQPVSYGFGWFLDPWEGHARMWHTGGTRGFRTVIQRFTHDGLTVVILCNRLDLDPGDLAEKAAAMVLSKTVVSQNMAH